MLRTRGPNKTQKKECNDPLNFVMIDIGSGNGSRAAQWANKYKQVHVFCFDPLEEANAQALTLQNDRLHVYKIAISSHPGELQFFRANDLSSCSLLPFGDHNAIKQWKYPPGKLYFKTTQNIQVSTIRMDKFLTDRRIPRVMFVRIETQGTALDVVQSFGKEIKNVLEFAIKVHVTEFDIYENQTHKKELIEYMNENGFSVYDMRSYSQNQEEIIWFVNRVYVKHVMTHNDLI